MSEVSTGIVKIPDFADRAVAATADAAAINFGTVAGIGYFEDKHGAELYKNILNQVRGHHKRNQLPKLNTPLLIAQRAKKISLEVLSDKKFNNLVAGFSDTDKHILAAEIAAEDTALKPFMSSIFQKMGENKLPITTSLIDKCIDKGVMDFASKKLQYITDIVKNAAASAGFAGSNILKDKNNIFDGIFKDSQNHSMTVFAKLGKELNPALAIDLAGFKPKECEKKMNEIISYLHEHGVPFQYTSAKHNQPFGVLRKMLDEKQAAAYLLNQTNKKGGTRVSAR